MQEALRRAVIYNSHHPITVGHPGTPLPYDNLRSQFCSLYLVLDIYKYVEQNDSCRKHSPSKKQQRKMQLFPPSRRLEFMAIHILAYLTKKRQRSRLVVVMKDCYSTLTGDIPTIRVSAPMVATIFLKHWVVPYGIPNTLLTDNGPQFASKVLSALCASQLTRLIATTDSHPQSNGLVEQYVKALEARR